MSAITISRQMGSLGRDVARAVGERLGYRVVWRELINQAARRAGQPELALAAIDELGLLGLAPPTAAIESYTRAVAAVMEELVAAGNVVIVGRAGQIILRGRPDVLHVRVVAPLPIRIARIADQQGVSLDAARAQVEASDRSRRAYLKRFHHCDWDDPDLYDLIINTERIDVSIAADMICAAVRAGAPAATSSSAALGETAL
ncbi:MAG: cytidylate kinase-like family protein [Anaerolineae bacterium]|nr:cytidylate kinase-like family protein [Thermoflexales bacterium]MDW8406518.1 cytidylate kinase-like family protein [Anaerolineae bacterium]